MTDLDARVFLIGGTSHAGKTTWGNRLASQTGGQLVSTDTFARHPGRPWKTMPETVPPHVAAHYLTLPTDALIADVVRHYNENIWPKVCETVRAHLSSGANAPLIMEGSALLPERADEILSETVRGVWLTASPAFLRERIVRESDYASKSRGEKQMIDAFAARTALFNARIVETATRLSLVLVDVETSGALDKLVVKKSS